MMRYAKNRPSEDNPMMERPIRLRHNVPFYLDDDQILYLDPSVGEHISQTAFDGLREKYSRWGITLLSPQSIVDSIPDDLLDYFLPERHDDPLPDATIMARRLAGEMQIILDRPQTLRCEGGIWFNGFGSYSDEKSEDFLLNYLEDICGRRIIPEECQPKWSVEGICYDADMADSMPSGCLPYSDEDFNYEEPSEEFSIDRLLEELRQANEDRLREIGLSEQALRFLLGYSNPKYSRLRVTRNAAIILEDYGGREIKMDDKTKALYFLYLRHPEGLSIKDLPDHSGELLDLYQSISGRDDPDAMRKTIENLCDPFQNNACISLSRIKKAFCEAFTPLVARQYYIDGERGGLRRIALDRSIVSWDTVR